MTYLLSQMEDLRLRLEDLAKRLGPEAETDLAAKGVLLELTETLKLLSAGAQDPTDCDAELAAAAPSTDAWQPGEGLGRPAVEVDGRMSSEVVGSLSSIDTAISVDGESLDHYWSKLIEAMDSPVIIASPDRRSISMNDAARLLFGIDDRKISPDGHVSFETCRRSIPMEYQGMHARVLHDLRNGFPPKPFASDAIAHDGRRVRIRWSIAVITDERGSGLQIVYSGRDVTTEHELKAQLASFDRLDSVGLLAGGLTHDFNNLLTIAGGNLELALDIGAMDETSRARIEAALDAIEHGGEIAHRLLKVANHSPDSSAEGGSATNVVEVVNALVDMLAGVVGAGIRINVESVSPVSGVDMDSIHLEQVVLNLIMNACDAMHNEGSIVITIRDVPESEPAAIELTVRDDGPGMEPSKLEQIFAPFSTESNGEGHTGLGLTTARILVESVGGSLAAVSELGVGTEMILNLPIERSGGGVNARRSVDSVDAGR